MIDNVTRVAIGGNDKDGGNPNREDSNNSIIYSYTGNMLKNEL